MANTEWSDDEFLGYFSLHATTPRALFHRDHVVRLLKMAGQPIPTSLSEWIAVRSDIADPLIEQAHSLKLVEEVHGR